MIASKRLPTATVPTPQHPISSPRRYISPVHHSRVLPLLPRHRRRRGILIQPTFIAVKIMLSSPPAEGRAGGRVQAQSATLRGPDCTTPRCTSPSLATSTPKSDPKSTLFREIVGNNQ